MKVNVYSIFDEKAAAYAPPFFMGHNGQAIRAFSDLVEDNKSAISRHPADYTLYKLGEFDDNSGVIKGVQPEFLARASDFVSKDINKPVEVV